MPKNKIAKRTLDRLFDINDLFKETDGEELFVGTKVECKNLAEFCKWYIKKAIKSGRC